MDNLLSKVNSAICNIDSCIASVGAKVVKSATYGREAKKSKYLSKLSHLDLIKSRLSRYKDTFLTDNCWPTVCNVDPCLQKVSVGCIDYVSNSYFISQDGRFERWSFSQYNRSLGSMVSMSKADDNGSNPVSYNRFRFYKWDNCTNSVSPISGYIDAVSSSGLEKFFYSEGRDEYFVVGDQWMMKLDSNFGVIDSISYGGNRNWESMCWDDDNEEIYIPDRANNSLDIVSMVDLSLKSTTVLPSGVPVPGGGQIDPVDCVYKDGGLLILGGNKAWHLNVSTLTPTLVIDGDGTGYVKGTPVLDNDGVARSISYVISSKKIEVDTWVLNSGTAFVTNSIDTGMVSQFPQNLVSLVFGIEFDGCNNMYFYNVDYIERAGKSINFYDKNLKLQDSVSGIFINGGAYWSLFNKSNNKIYHAFQRSTSSDTVVIDVDKSDGNKVNIYPEMCTPFTEDDICDLITTAGKICSSICK